MANPATGKTLRYTVKSIFKTASTVFSPSIRVTVLLLALLVFGAQSLGAPPLAHAAAITVNSTANTVADDGLCTLREAITAANTDTSSGATLGECPAGSGVDTIELGAAATYILDVADNMSDGPNGLPDITSVIVINGNGATFQRDPGARIFRIFHIASGSGLTLNDVTISGGLVDDFGGGGVYTAGTLTVTDGAITGNLATDFSEGGGGIYIESGFTDITNSTISGNSANIFSSFGGGGGILSGDSTLNEGTGNVEVTASTITENSAGFGGGAGIFHESSGLFFLVNTIVANDRTGKDCNGDGAISTGGYNITGDFHLRSCRTGRYAQHRPVDR